MNNHPDKKIKKDRKYGQYVEVFEKDLVPGDVLDMGTYKYHKPGLNDNVVWIVMEFGQYSETKGAKVRVWI